MSDHFTHLERALIVLQVGGCVGPKASVNGLKNLLPVLRIVSQLFGYPAHSVLIMLTGSVQTSWLSARELTLPAVICPYL
jgi:hypothetical protein